MIQLDGAIFERVQDCYFFDGNIPVNFRNFREWIRETNAVGDWMLETKCFSQIDDAHSGTLKFYLQDYFNSGVWR